MSKIVYVFVHVPKTAGTSFRLALEQQFGADGLAYDYGAKSPVTSSIVKEHVYLQPDLDRFQAAIIDSPVQVVCGHVTADKFKRQFSPEHTMIFLRDPVQRLVSEYQHFVRVHNYDEGFSAFINTTNYINRQLAFANGIPLAKYGFIGITEHYNTSLAMANRTFDWALNPLEMNLGRPQLESCYELDAELESELEQLNQDDLAYYHDAYQEFKQRIEAVS